MHLEVFTEEVSAETCLETLLPKILGAEVTFAIHPFQGKAALLRELPRRLRALGRFLADDSAVVVLVDADNPKTCRLLKAKLETWAQEAGLSTQSRRASGEKFQVLNRIAVEELEAWFLGDVDALRAAYPRVPSTLAQRKGFRDPDAIRNTWETLERLLQKSGYHPQGLPKIAVARAISANMDPARNASRSFQVFRDGLRDLVGA